MTHPVSPDSGADREQPFISHLIELRDRLLRVVAAVLLVFLGLFPFANDIYTLLARPLMRHLPEGTSMIATEVASPFLTPFKLALVLAFFIAIPYVLYQAWAFVAPGLYRHEKRLVLPLVVSSTLLYYLGMAFAYFVVFPIVFGFFISVAPEGVAVMTDIAAYLDFVLKLFFAFGVAFEVPVATVLLVVTGMTTAQALAEKRPYIIVGVFVIAMLLTPPDVVSQTLLALPVWSLFELGVLMARLIEHRRKEVEDEDGEPDPGGGSSSAPGPAAGPGGAAGPGTGMAVAAGAAAGTADAVPGALQVEDLFDDEDDDFGEDDEDEVAGDDPEHDAQEDPEPVSPSATGDEGSSMEAEAPQPPAGEEASAQRRFVAEGASEELDLMSGDPEPPAGEAQSSAPHRPGGAGESV
jgi:sec-independent protein translocase protein TatC